MGLLSYLQSVADTAWATQSSFSTTPVTDTPTHSHEPSVLLPVVSVEDDVSVSGDNVPSSSSSRLSSSTAAPSPTPSNASTAATSSAAPPKQKLDANKLFQTPTSFASQQVGSPRLGHQPPLRQRQQQQPPGPGPAPGQTPDQGPSPPQQMQMGRQQPQYGDWQPQYPYMNPEWYSHMQHPHMHPHPHQPPDMQPLGTPHQPFVQSLPPAQQTPTTTATMSPRTGPIPTLPPPSSSTPVPHPNVPQINTSVPPSIPSPPASARPTTSITPSAREVVPGGMSGSSPMIPSPGFPLPKKSNAIKISNPNTGEAVVLRPPDVGHTRNLSRDTAMVHESSPLRKVQIRMESPQNKKAREEKEAKQRERKVKEKQERKEREEAEAKARAEAEEKIRKEAEEAARLAAEAKAKGEAKAKEREEKEKLQAPSLSRTPSASSVATPSSASPKPGSVSVPAKPTLLPIAMGGYRPRMQRPVPGPLDLSSTQQRAPLKPGFPGALASARKIDDLDSVTYPEGIKIPSVGLNQGQTKGGKYKYDRDFLLQFMQVCKDKPDNLSSLDSLGIERGAAGDDNGGPFFGSGGRAQGRRMASMGPPGPNRSASLNMGLGLNFPGGKNAPTPFGSMGNFSSTPRRLTRSQRAKARNDSLKPNASQLSQQQQQQQQALSGLEPVPASQQSENRWNRNRLHVDENSPEFVWRRVNGLLNKLMLENFDSVSNQIIGWANRSENENNGATLILVIKLVFERATDEAHWSEMYARLCRKMMEQISVNVQDDDIRNYAGEPIVGGHLFRKYLLNRCQEDFERGWSQKESAQAAAALNAADDKAAAEAASKGGDGEDNEPVLYSDEYYALLKAKRQGLGLVRFIGELFKLQMLTERNMHQCIKKLLSKIDKPEEEEIESLCELLMTAGQALDTPKAKGHMDIYFGRMQMLAENSNIASRIRYMLLDVIELRGRSWRPRNAAAGPSTIAQVCEQRGGRNAQENEGEERLEKEAEECERKEKKEREREEREGAEAKARAGAEEQIRKEVEEAVARLAAEAKAKEREEKEKEKPQAPLLFRTASASSVATPASVSPKPGSTSLPTKPILPPITTGGDRSRMQRPAPGPLELSSILHRALPTAGSPSAFASAIKMDDLDNVTYPEGIKTPSMELKPEGDKYKYDRDFLLQLIAICKDKLDELDNLSSLDTVGIERGAGGHDNSGPSFR